MASQSQGIQQLLQAEKRAAEKVAEARKRKNRRLKQAKEEAQAEIEQYRLQREKEFKTKEAAVRFIHLWFKDPFVSIAKSCQRVFWYSVSRRAFIMTSSVWLLPIAVLISEMTNLKKKNIILQSVH
uniref:V-type proton ATPase subunit G n=1 Tax=Cyprinus carpio carpio TaxID=630221 RepID=A0A9J8BK89_CYPCA